MNPVVSMKGKINIDKELCKGCGYCIVACPLDVINFDKGFNSMSYLPAVPVDNSKCNGCGLCAVVCPDIAIEVWREDKKGQSKRPSVKTRIGKAAAKGEPRQKREGSRSDPSRRSASGRQNYGKKKN